MQIQLMRLSQRTLTMDCYHALKHAILNLELPPGTVLAEQKLASQFGISKTPVREALARLIAEGFVDVAAGRKLQVAGLHPEMIRDLYRVRLLLEPAAIREVAPHITDRALDELGALVNEASDALEVGEALSFVTANERFHAYLMELTGNEYLLTIFKGLFDRVHRIRSSIYFTEHEAHQYAFAQQGIVNHQHIVEALSERNPHQAENAMRTDIQLFLDVAFVSDTRVTVNSVVVPGSGPSDHPFRS